MSTHRKGNKNQQDGHTYPINPFLCILGQLESKMCTWWDDMRMVAQCERCVCVCVRVCMYVHSVVDMIAMARVANMTLGNNILT